MINKNIIIKGVTNKDGAKLKHLAVNCAPLDIHTPYTYWVVASYFGEYSFIAYDKNTNKEIGYITCVKNNNTALIWQIGIIKEYRGMGISQLLIDSVIKKLNEDCSDLDIEVTISEDNICSYGAFKKYCKNNNYDLCPIDDVKIIDLDNADYYEQTIKYNLKKLIDLRE